MPTFKIPGRTFPVEKFHSKNNSDDYVDGAVNQALMIHTQPHPGNHPRATHHNQPQHRMNHPCPAHRHPLLMRPHASLAIHSSTAGPANHHLQPVGGLKSRR